MKKISARKLNKLTSETRYVTLTREQINQLGGVEINQVYDLSKKPAKFLEDLHSEELILQGATGIDVPFQRRRCLFYTIPYRRQLIVKYELNCFKVVVYSNQKGESLYLKFTEEMPLKSIPSTLIVKTISEDLPCETFTASVVSFARTSDSILSERECEILADILIQEYETVQSNEIMPLFTKAFCEIMGEKEKKKLGEEKQFESLLIAQIINLGLPSNFAEYVVSQKQKWTSKKEDFADFVNGIQDANISEEELVKILCQKAGLL